MSKRERRRWMRPPTKTFSPKVDAPASLVFHLQRHDLAGTRSPPLEPRLGARAASSRGTRHLLPRRLHRNSGRRRAPRPAERFLDLVRGRPSFRAHRWRRPSQRTYSSVPRTSSRACSRIDDGRRRSGPSSSNALAPRHDVGLHGCFSRSAEHESEPFVGQADVVRMCVAEAEAPSSVAANIGKQRAGPTVPDESRLCCGSRRIASTGVPPPATS